MGPGAHPIPAVLDLSRLLGRAWQGRQLTGVDRVASAYAQRFSRPTTRALLRWRGWRKVLSPAASMQLHQLLADPSRHGTPALRAELLQLLASQLTTHLGRPAASALAHTPVLYPTHTGIEHPSLVPWVRATGQVPRRPLLEVFRRYPRKALLVIALVAA